MATRPELYAKNQHLALGPFTGLLTSPNQPNFVKTKPSTSHVLDIIGPSKLGAIRTFVNIVADTVMHWAHVNNCWDSF